MIRLWTGMAAAALLLGACAQSTPYQPVDGGRYGFEEQRIESDRYLVTFTGNSLTDRETVETYLLFRAAELTLEQGYDYFTVVRRDTEEESRIVGTAPSYYDRFHVRYRYFHPYYGWYGWRDPFWDDVSLREINRYEAIAEIVMGRGPTPDDPDAFDASEVVANLGDRVRRPEPQ
ncbi:hypothetical protein E5163_07195 [Marinicauda algicola]|uniref:DUF4136 domain-containing protein n=1 Tax=Marinicauda algicola TaxID=2029849 RepID=A0A4S2H074_9PROT|nr:hypothetical protein [Marinicauda algicola]TGY88915.1 hypothetical protein E5163_07195 [Marinicauda algicola]